MELKELITKAWNNRELLKDIEYSEAVNATMVEIDKGRLRAAEPTVNGWVVNEWAKQAILMFFTIQRMQTYSLPPFEFYDKIPLKTNFRDQGVRAVPHAVAR